MKYFSTLVPIFAVILSVSMADIYLHVPRGSNNRFNEKSAQRKNANRLFDSQNNNRGGYNVGDKTKAKANNEGSQYRMKYFQSGPHKTLRGDNGKSFLTVEWTNQHGCGGNEDSSPQKQNCQLILQFMCQEIDIEDNDDKLRNGADTKTQDFTKPNKKNVNQNRKGDNVKNNRGLHETWDWYNKCYLRKRNMGLFVADQKPKANNGMGYSSAVFTRQNANGNRYGYECPEERDYYPYWHPTPWKDIAVMAENATMCSHYKKKSFNVQPYGECVETENKGWSQYNNKATCENNGGSWKLLYNYLEKATDKRNKNACEGTKTSGMTYKWAVAYDSSDYEPECLVMLDAPECLEAPWSRSNHLGNGRDAAPLNFTWTLPHFPSNTAKRCVLRMRYNISTDDYDPYHTDSSHNDNFPVKSPIQQNPYVYVMGQQTPLRLAINTAQFGRVFQDRSHVFHLDPRPDGTSESKIFNLNVRGKRGNIVQVYPAVEYDFAPNRLEIKKNDLVHIQWTGSNSHNNGNPAGDGQAGSAGEGKDGTDRSNFVELKHRSGNFPTPFEETKLWNNVEIMWIYHGKKDITPRDLAVNLASSGYYRCVDSESCPEKQHEDYLVSTKSKMNNLLDNAPASYNGVLLKFKTRGMYHYMCTRNNNFTNRSQKGAIVVK